MANIRDFAVGIVTAVGAGTFTLRSGEGDTMPLVPFYMTLTPPSNLSTRGTSEKVLVTAKSTDTLTYTGQQGETTTKSIAAGWIAVNAIYAEDLFNSSVSWGVIPTGTIDGSNRVFTLPTPCSSVMVFKNGVRMRAGSTEDYTFTSNNTITFNVGVAPATGSVILVDCIIGSQVMIQGSNSIINREVPAGTINGTNKVFTTARPYVGGSTEVFVNGLRQSSVHYTETSPSTGVITFDEAPLTGDLVDMNYQHTTGVSGNADTLDGYHANATPTANQIPVLGPTGRMPVSTQKLHTAKATIGGSGLSVGSGTFVTVGFSSEYYDTDGIHDNATNNNRFTVGYAGVYLICLSVLWDGGTPWGSGRTIVNLRRNGGTICELWDGTVGGSGEPSQSFAVEFDAAVGDYFDVEMYQASGGAKTLNAGTSMSVSYRGAIT